MQIVINISEELYEMILNLPDYISAIATQAVRDGIPLPKGHGDLIDVNRKITVPVYDEQYEEWGEKILTVREALNRWSDEGITVKDIVILTDKAENKEHCHMTADELAELFTDTGSGE